MTTQQLVIYHADCTDGFGAAFAAWLKFGDTAEYLPMHYGTNLPLERISDREVYVLDFSFAKPAMEVLFTEAKRVVWLDHHKTAFEAWLVGDRDYYEPTPATRYGRENYILLDNNKSGALLAWEYFHPYTQAPALIRHIDDRDRWQFKICGSKEVHATLSSMKPWSFDQWLDTFFDSADISKPLGLEYFYKAGNAILRAQDANVMQMVKHARECTISCGITDFPAGRAHGLAVNASLHQSELGHELANQSGTYGLIYYIGADGKVNCSLRSNGNYDVSVIAKAFGGGGHRNAAGFQTDVDTLVRWMK